MEDEIFELNKDALCSLKTLDKSKVYPFTLNAGDASKSQAALTQKQPKSCLDEVGIVGVYTVKTNDGYGDIPAIESLNYQNIWRNMLNGR